MPIPPQQLLEEAVEAISTAVLLSEGTSPSSHTVVLAAGLDDPVVATSLGRYAVGFLAGWVQRNATIGSRLGVVGVQQRDEVRRLVDRIIVPPGRLDDEGRRNWRQTWRDAWLAEVLTHVLFLIRRSVDSPSLKGGVVALLRPHPLPKRQGLDSVAIYDEASVAVIAIGETKASSHRGSDELTNACDIFDAIDEGLYGPDLRDAIDVLSDVLPSHLADQMSDSIWRDERCYVPVVAHQTAFDYSSVRPRLARLKPIVARKRVLVLRLSAFDAFFDAAAGAMVPAVDELVI